MMNFLGQIAGMVFDIVAMAAELAVGAVEMVLGLLGGLAALMFSAFGVLLIVVLAVVFFRRRRKAKAAPQRSDILVDENGETFTSFYHQKEE